MTVILEAAGYRNSTTQAGINCGRFYDLVASSAGCSGLAAPEALWGVFRKIFRLPPVRKSRLEERVADKNLKARLFGYDDQR